MKALYTAPGRTLSPVTTVEFQSPKNPKPSANTSGAVEQQRKLYQRQAAALLDVSTVTLSRWERDHTYPTWDYHARIIEYLGYDAFKQTGLKDPYGHEPHGVTFFADDGEGGIGQRIRQRRLELKLTVEECAQKLGIAARTLRDWEAGAHMPLKRYAEVLKSFVAENDLAESPIWNRQR